MCLDVTNTSKDKIYAFAIIANDFGDSPNIEHRFLFWSCCFLIFDLLFSSFFLHAMQSYVFSYFSAFSLNFFDFYNKKLTSSINLQNVINQNVHFCVAS